MQMREMAKTTTFLVLCVVVMAAVLSETTNAQTSMICKVKISELAECLPAIRGPSPKDPTKACCGVLRKADLRCMCKLKPQLSKYGLSPAKAMELPTKCGFKVPSGC